MAKQQMTTDALRERLTGLLADWGAEMSMLLRELDETRKELAEKREQIFAHDRELKTLEDRVRGQNELIDTMKAEAGTAEALRNEVRAKDLEFERLTSELESKQELIRALRRDAEAADRLKGESKAKDQEIASLQKERRLAGKRVTELEAALEAARQGSEDRDTEERAELEAVRAELDARKTLIKSLRGDADRVGALENRLEEKRDIVTKLEASINKHVETIAELKRASDVWKKKYQALIGRDSATTSTELPNLTDTDVAASQQLKSTDVAEPDRTVAIDMRRPLSEARRKTQSQAK